MADTLSLSPHIAARLAAAAVARGESADQLAGEAIEKFLDWDDDFRGAVARGVAEADAGQFAAEGDVAHVFRKRT